MQEQIEKLQSIMDNLKKYSKEADGMNTSQLKCNHALLSFYQIVSIIQRCNEVVYHLKEINISAEAKAVTNTQKSEDFVLTNSEGKILVKIVDDLITINSCRNGIESVNYIILSKIKSFSYYEFSIYEDNVILIDDFNYGIEKREYVLAVITELKTRLNKIDQISHQAIL